MCNVKIEFIGWTFFKDFISDIERPDIIHIPKLKYHKIAKLLTIIISMSDDIYRNYSLD